MPVADGAATAASNFGNRQPLVVQLGGAQIAGDVGAQGLHLAGVAQQDLVRLGVKRSGRDRTTSGWLATITQAAG